MNQKICETGNRLPRMHREIDLGRSKVDLDVKHFSGDLHFDSFED